MAHIGWEHAPYGSTWEHLGACSQKSHHAFPSGACSHICSKKREHAPVWGACSLGSGEHASMTLAYFPSASGRHAPVPQGACSSDPMLPGSREHGSREHKKCPPQWGACDHAPYGSMWVIFSLALSNLCQNQHSIHSHRLDPVGSESLL